jgi:hypothetical protein
MKRLRRIAALSFALILGVAAWCTVMLCRSTTGELRLSRELSSGLLMARVPRPKPLVFGMILFGPPNLKGTYTQPQTGASGPLPQGMLFEGSRTGPHQIWYVRLDPLDKSWEIEVKETRPVFLRLGKFSWRIGTKTRIWRTRRTVLASS